MDEYKFACDPVANPKSTVTGSTYRFTVLNDNVLRYEWAEDGHFEDRASTFALWRNFPKPEFRVEDEKDELAIITPRFRLTYDKQEFSPNGLVVRFTGKVTNAEWRFGQPTPDNLGGTARTLDNVDGRIDMGLGILSRAGFSILDDTKSMLFDESGFVSPRRPGERVDGYLFSYGSDYKAGMKAFYAVSGQQPSIPRWCLGNWWSRYHAYDDKEYLALMDRFRATDIPLSVAVLDINWHWVKQSFVPTTGWTGYSWNTNLFPKPREFQQKLHDRGLKVTLNDHPHEGIHSHEDVYEELAEVLGHDTTNGDPIEFDPTSPEFMYAFFNVVHRKLEKMGCDFWWIDWQQGSTSRIPGFDPLWLLNHFQYLDTKQVNPDSSSIIFSRYAGPGSHRYPIGFSGDTVATWESLRFQPEFTATASNIGFGWWSHDIGGHMLGDRDDERTARWIQLAVFSPILRLHSTQNRWMSKEPWLYRDESMRAIRDAMQFRHRLVPYIYSAAKSTLPLVQPLYWEFPTRDVAYKYPNQYFFGPSLVVSPIVDPGDTRTNLAKTKMWIPPKRHVDIFTGTVYDGDRELDVYRPVGSIPVLMPEGSIMPLDRETAPPNGCKNPNALEILVIVGKDGNFNLIEDPHDDRNRGNKNSTKKRTLNISYNQTTGELTFDNGGKEWKIRFLSTKIQLSKIKIHSNGHIIHFARCNDGTDTVVDIKPGSADSKISIGLGPDPQLAVLDHTETIERLLLDFQTKNELKDRIWEILQSEQSRATKISGLLSVEMEEAFRGPILELLLADSRSGE